MTDSTSGESTRNVHHDDAKPSVRKQAKSVEEAQEQVNQSPVAEAIREADEKGYFGYTDEPVPNEAFTVRGVTQDPERAAVSGRPHVAAALGRDEKGDKTGEKK